MLAIRLSVALLLILAGHGAFADGRTVVIPLGRDSNDKHFYVRKDSRLELKNEDTGSFYEIALFNAESRKRVATIAELKKDQSVRLSFAGAGTYLLHYSVRATGMDADETRHVWINVFSTASL
jgi:hypothetical protein